MDTIRQFEGAIADGGVGSLARALVEACVNEVMSALADAACEETGTSRNGFRERPPREDGLHQLFRHYRMRRRKFDLRLVLG